VYAGNDPIKLIDVNGDSIEIGYSSVATTGIPVGNHTMLIHTNEETGEEATIVEGWPTNESSFGSEGYGKLEKEINTPSWAIGSEDRETVPIPEGKTEEEFLANIKRASDSYTGDVDYSPIPSVENETGNSNSLVGSVLTEAGSDFQPSRTSPGFNVNVLSGRVEERKALLRKKIDKIVNGPIIGPK